MLRAFAIPITWTELFKRTVREFNADNCLGLAAQLAYYLLLGLVPALVFLVSIASFFPADTIQQMLGRLATFTPAEMMTLVRTEVETIAGRENGGLLTFGFIAALWSSSAAVVAVTDALNRAYDIEESRPWWKLRLTAIGLTIGLAVVILVAFALILIGPAAAEWLARTTGLGSPLEWAWKILQWPVAFALVAVGLALLNYFGPDADQDLSWITPGSVLATILWLVVSLAFKIYLANFADYGATYGSLGGAIVLMLWFYLSGMAILVGAEMNAEIEHASPWGKAPGEKVPGQRRSLGARARKAWEARDEVRPKRTDVSGQHSEPAPIAPAPVKTVVDRSRRTSLFPGLPLFMISWWLRRRRERK
jgi:membrane protein